MGCMTYISGEWSVSPLLAISYAVSFIAWLGKVLLWKMFANVYAVIKMLCDYPLETVLFALFVGLVYNIFLYLGFGQKRSIKLSAPYLDHAYYIEQLQKGHSEPHHFYHLQIGPLSRPMYCIACREAITGVFSNALCCDVCGYSVHTTCIDQALPNCKSVAMFPSQDDAVRFLHYVRDGVDIEPNSQSNSNPTTTSPVEIKKESDSVAAAEATIPSATEPQPRQRVRTRSMLRQLEASPAPQTRTRSRSRRGRTTTPRTASTPLPAPAAPTPAPSVSTVYADDATPAFPPARPRDFPLWHRWLQGNHSTIADVCVACSQPTGSLFAMAGLHCTWCGTHVHEHCLASLDSDALEQRRYCSMGPLARLLVPPYAVFPARGHTIASARHALATRYTHVAMARARAAGAQPVVEQLFEFALPAWCSPLLVFVNRKSGGNRGVELMHDFADLLNPLQVWDLADHPPEVALSLFRGLPRLRVLCCGGDGTVAWVLSALDALAVTAPVAVMPLGTGNDLAQVLGWGGSCPQDALSYVLHRVQESGVAVLDRWDARAEELPEKTISNSNPTEAAAAHDPEAVRSSSSKRTTKSPAPAAPSALGALTSRALAPLAKLVRAVDNVFPLLVPTPRGFGPRECVVNNYMGFGLDAVIAHQFHLLRNAHPMMFQHQLGNKAWYARIGTEQSLVPYMRGGMRERGARLFVDGREIPIGDFQGVCVLNIKSFGGGSNFWGDSPDDFVQQTSIAGLRNASTRTDAQPSFSPPRMDDGLVEVVGFRHAVHMLMIQQGRILPERLAQGREVIITTEGPLPVQVDGEPWGVKENCRIRISLRGQALMLAPANGTPALLRHVNSSLTRTLEDVLHWGSAQGILQPAQRDALLTEFSKRYSKLVPASAYYNPAPADED